MKAKVCAMYDAGRTMQEIGDAVGVSRQRVQQILSMLRPHKGKRPLHSRAITDEEITQELLRKLREAETKHRTVYVSPKKLRQLLAKGA